MELPSDYNGDNMLIGATNLNRDISGYLDYIGSNAEPSVLAEYKLDIEEYLTDIPPYDFAPRTDGLVKEAVLMDLNNNLQRINELLQVERGGKRRRRRNKSKRKTHSRKTRSKRYRKSLRRRH